MAGFTVENAVQTITLSDFTTGIIYFGDTIGTIDVSVSGGTEPYVYEWQPAVSGNVQDLIGLSPGIYAQTATDTNGCTTLVQCIKFRNQFLLCKFFVPWLQVFCMGNDVDDNANHAS